ncbi:Sugar transporter, partial [Operophtera brumata]
LIVCTGVWNCYFLIGLCMGTPTVMVPQLRAANVTISDETASWLRISIPWIVLLSILTAAIGRKKTHIIVTVSCLISYSILYFSKTVNDIFVSNIFQGVISAAFLTTSVVILTEFTSTKYRGIFLTLKSATFFWGILTANTIGTFSNWHNIAIVGFVCSVYSLLTVTIWPESPYWLAGKGKFVECSKSHTWLKGSDAETLRELENIVKYYQSERFFKQNNIQSVIKTFFSKASLKPILLSSLLTCLYVFSGKLIFTVYAIDVLKKITKDNWTAYKGMLILDSVTVLSMYLGCFLSKKLKRRTMLLLFSSLGATFLFILSGYLYLIKLSIVVENTYVSISLLAAYSITTSCGPIIMSTSIIGELLPVESKCIFMCIIAFIFKSIFSTLARISPYIFKHFNMHGTFLLYGVLTVVCLVLIYFYLPETKNKTLQEIDESLRWKTTKSIEETSKLMPALIRKNNVTFE